MACWAAALAEPSNSRALLFWKCVAKVMKPLFGMSLPGDFTDIRPAHCVEFLLRCTMSTIPVQVLYLLNGKVLNTDVISGFPRNLSTEDDNPILKLKPNEFKLLENLSDPEYSGLVDLVYLHFRTALVNEGIILVKEYSYRGNSRRERIVMPDFLTCSCRKGKFCIKHHQGTPSPHGLYFWRS